MVDIIMPQLGETVTEGTVTRWSKAVGEAVTEDEVLFEVSTDKVDSEVRSPASGYLAEILVPEGETVDVGVRLAVIASDPLGAAAGANGTSVSTAPLAPPAVDGPPPPPAPAAPAAAASAAANPAAAAAVAPNQGAPQMAAAAPDVQPAPQPGVPGDGQPSPFLPGSDPWAAAEHDSDDAHVNLGSSGGDLAGRVLSPVVRRLLAEHGLDPAAVAGTGAGGRITRADVLTAVDLRRAALAAPPAQTAAQPPAVPAPAGPPLAGPPLAGPPLAGPPLAGPPLAGPPPASAIPAAPAPVSLGEVAHYSAPRSPAPVQAPGGLVRSPPAGHAGLAPGARDEVVPFSNIRRRTAEHMVRSQATSAHTLVAMEIDFEAVESARRAHKDRFLAEEGVKLTYLPFIARALADAITAFPHLNSSVGDDCLIVHRDLHLGIAVDLGDEGLIVPVIHEAGDKRLRALAREAAELARRARTRKLGADDISGGTFTITNPGPFGTFMTVPVINQPQVAILSTDGVKRRPVVIKMPDGTEGIAIHSTGMLALSFDHRAVDGAYASRFLDRMREILQGRDWALEL